MQEEIENKSITLIINCTKFTGRVLKSAISKYLAHRSAKRHEKRMDKKAAKQAKSSIIPHGKQTVKQLIGQNQGVSTMDVSDKDIKDFQKVARKYGVDYAVRKTKDTPPKYVVFFKSKDQDSMESAFKEFTAKKVRQKGRVPFRKQLAKVMPFIGSRKAPEKNKNQERSR